MKLFKSGLVILCALTPLLACAAGKEKSPPPADVVVPLAQRPFIAVVSFDDGTLQKQEWWGSRWDVGSGLADILTTNLLDRSRFRLVERGLLDKVIQEQDLGATNRVDPKSAAKIGKVLGADYLIMGKVTQFSWGTKSTGGIVPIKGLLGAGVSKTKAEVAVDLRIVDANTSEILGSYTGRGDESKGSFVIAQSRIGAFGVGSSDFMNSILGRATQKAIADWTDNLCKAIDNGKLELPAKHQAPVRPDGVVLDVTGSKLVANTGTDKGFAVGDRVEIHRKGKELKDPDTGEVLRVVTELIGVGTITKIDGKTADITYTLTDKSKVMAEGDLVRFVEGDSK